MPTTGSFDHSGGCGWFGYFIYFVSCIWRLFCCPWRSTKATKHRLVSFSEVFQCGVVHYWIDDVVGEEQHEADVPHDEDKRWERWRKKIGDKCQNDKRCVDEQKCTHRQPSGFGDFRADVALAERCTNQRPFASFTKYGCHANIANNRDCAQNDKETQTQDQVGDFLNNKFYQTFVHDSQCIWTKENKCQSHQQSVRYQESVVNHMQPLLGNKSLVVKGLDNENCPERRGKTEIKWQRSTHKNVDWCKSNVVG